MTTPDNPLQNSTLAQIEKAESGGPYVYVCRNGKDKITFPDLGEMDWFEAEEFMSDIQEMQAREWLPKWLADKDFERFKKEKIPMSQIIGKWVDGKPTGLAAQILNHYEKLMGDSGEGDASPS